MNAQRRVYRQTQEGLFLIDLIEVEGLFFELTLKNVYTLSITNK